MEQDNICLNCKHFTIWDEDPCCLEKDEWKITLPSMSCKKFDMETFKPAIKLRESCWSDCKKSFFDRYTITEEDLVAGYLKYYPGDESLINKGNG